MKNFTFENLITILNHDVLAEDFSIEINFSFNEYTDCYIGKMPDLINSKKEIYWYSMPPNKEDSYIFDYLDDILTHKIFQEKTLTDIFSEITWHSLDGCSFEEMLHYYIDK
ncbi:MAG: hypothetical protein ACRDAU_05310 [Clostridium sp.]